MYRCKWFSIKFVTGRCQNDSVLAARCTCKALLRSAAAALEHLTARTLSTGGASRPGAHAITRILNASALSYRADRRLEPSQVVADHCERLFWWTPQLTTASHRASSPVQATVWLACSIGRDGGASFPHVTELGIMPVPWTDGRRSEGPRGEDFYRETRSFSCKKSRGVLLK